MKAEYIKSEQHQTDIMECLKQLGKVERVGGDEYSHKIKDYYTVTSEDGFVAHVTVLVQTPSSSGWRRVSYHVDKSYTHVVMGLSQQTWLNLKEGKRRKHNLSSAPLVEYLNAEWEYLQQDWTQTNKQDNYVKRMCDEINKVIPVKYHDMNDRPAITIGQLEFYMDFYSEASNYLCNLRSTVTTHITTERYTASFLYMLGDMVNAGFRVTQDKYSLSVSVQNIKSIDQLVKLVERVNKTIDAV